MDPMIDGPNLSAVLCGMLFTTIELKTKKPMKTRIAFLLSLLLAGFQSHAQDNFSGFNYQAVVRDAQGQPLANQAVGVEFILHCNPALPYHERHTTTSDAHGLINLVIGEGTPVFGTFALIDWTGCSPSSWILNVSMDITGGTNYDPVGSQELKAVPFAIQTLSPSNSDDGDWVVTGDTLHSDGKRVGIGTIGPRFDLHLGPGSGIANGFGHGIAISSHIPRIYFEETDAPLNERLMDLHRDNNGLAIGSLTDDGSSWTNANILFAGSNGNVGIGTSTPRSLLDVSTGTNTTGYKILAGGNEISILERFNGVDFASKIWSEWPGTGKLHFGVNGFSGVPSTVTPILTISHADNQSTTGSVGIGVTNPQHRLHVDGGAKVERYLEIGNTYTNYTSGAAPEIYGGNGGGFFSGDLILQSRTNNPIGADIHLATGVNNVISTKLVVKANGNIGIGTDVPSAKLDVNGDIQCEGKIYCREVEVTLAAFPDYVFDAGYELMPLAEVEAFIAANGHLPNVPSACEVEEHGLGLGEMNKILLEKVEELTLHMIDKENDIQALRIDLAVQAAMLETIIKSSK